MDSTPSQDFVSLQSRVSSDDTPQPTVGGFKRDAAGFRDPGQLAAATTWLRPLPRGQPLWPATAAVKQELTSPARTRTASRLAEFALAVASASTAPLPQGGTATDNAVPISLPDVFHMALHRPADLRMPARGRCPSHAL
ncbi:hypothetical protein GGTG_08517 [Gaeumannomyces tritici R3-111a-1]|uniref:Uncharacterized protein n=1 Tax=Gaeumannomyces tritici (strain R3-111a-1) TaxID=644352 RepID=J3P4T2_GAET3|nr:hypothetical protein GGTG_08517 [Gaeumannomyces tritici R3-111a-1]EJT74679.1 hypothetical protein GGTG_08517 [Gaeumannomyces tritici R3-111a-1]